MNVHVVCVGWGIFINHNINKISPKNKNDNKKDYKRYEGGENKGRGTMDRKEFQKKAVIIA